MKLPWIEDWASFQEKIEFEFQDFLITLPSQGLFWRSNYRSKEQLPWFFHRRVIHQLNFAEWDLGCWSTSPLIVEKDDFWKMRLVTSDNFFGIFVLSEWFLQTRENRRFLSQRKILKSKFANWGLDWRFQGGGFVGRRVRTNRISEKHSFLTR